MTPMIDPEELKQYQGEYGDIPIGGVSLPEGQHQCELKSAKMIKTQKGIRVVLEWCSLAGDHKDWTHDHWLQLTGAKPRAISISKEVLSELGFEDEVVDDLEAVQESLSDLIGTEGNITVDRNGFARLDNVINAPEQEEAPPPVKRGRGRPKGSKDRHPRARSRRPEAAPEEGDDEGDALSDEFKQMFSGNKEA